MNAFRVREAVRLADARGVGADRALEAGAIVGMRSVRRRHATAELRA
jgi:hypothetical protein